MSRAATAAACIQCGLPAATPREGGTTFCCTGCAWMHRVVGPTGVDASADDVLPRVLLCAFLSMGTMVFSLALIGVDPHVAPGGEDASVALQGLYRLGAMALSFPVLVLLGVPLIDAVARARSLRSADGLILVAVGAAWALSAWNTFAGDGTGSVYFDTAAMVLVLVSLGRYLEARARGRAADGLRDAAGQAVGPVRIVDGMQERDVRLEDVEVGDHVRVRAGEEIPVDGEVVEGRAFVDTAAMTGEEEPRSIRVRDRVLAGVRALDGTLLIRAESVGTDRVAALVAKRLATARADRAPLVRVADRAAGGLLPAILLIAIGSGVLAANQAGAEAGLLRALSVLLIACPCALGLAIPLAYQTALGAAWSRGVLLRDGATLERLARAKRVLFDKTGTLTEGTPRLDEVRLLGAGPTRDEVLGLALALERASDHPLARALRRAGSEASAPHANDIRVLPGVGVEGFVGRRHLRLVRSTTAAEPGRTVTRLEVDGEDVAELTFLACVRPGAADAVRALREQGLDSAILTGDSAGAAEVIADELDLPFEASLLPHEKLERVTDAGENGRAHGVIFVGDGINDAAALAGADVGCVLSRSAALARDQADVHIVHDDLAELPRMIVLARRAVRVARGNLAWAFAYNAIGVALAAAGRLTPIFAASAMVVSSVVVVLRSTRLVPAEPRAPQPEPPPPRLAAALREEAA